jgi:hypothetical protein
MSRRTKLMVLAVPVLLALVSAGVLASSYLRPTTAERSVVIATYVASESFDCEIYLQPNSLYETPTIGPEQKIFAQLVDHIEAPFRCSVNVNTDQQVSINGTYTIVADVQTDDWVKRVVIKPQTSLSGQGRSVRLDEAFTLDLAGWGTIVSTINDETGTSPKNPRTVITATVVVTVSAGEMTESTSMSATMEVPLRQTSYNIVIANPSAQNGSLTATETVVQRSVQDQRRYSLIAMLVAIFLSLAVLMFVRRVPTYVSEKDADSVLRETLRKKQKKYKDHLVAAAQIVQPTSAGTTVTTTSLEELVKLADELGKPVLFTDSEDPNERPVYYVLDGSVSYQWMPFASRITPVAKKTGKLPGQI